MKRLLYILLGLIVFILLLLGSAIAWVMNADLKPIAEKQATEALGRRVAADQLEIHWGNPIHIELRNLRIANASWGSTPEMITLESFSADVDPYSLWDGTPLYYHLRAAKPVVVLERDEKGLGNWKFGDPSSSSSSSGGFALIPKNRTQFPTLLDMAMSDGLITYRTYSGNVLRISLENVAIRSESDDTPVSLKAAGAYNNTPLILDAKTQSFKTLRDAGTPFGTVFTIAGKTAKIDFDGTMMEPLDFDGVDGQMKLDAQELDNLLASFGADIPAKYPLIVDGHLMHKGDHWALTKVKGRIAEDDFTGTLTLDEGSKGAPDNIATDLSFSTLDLNRLIAEDPNAKSTDILQTSLLAPQDAGVNLDAKIKTKQFTYGSLKLSDAAIDGGISSGSLTLKALSFAYAGGRISATASVRTKAKRSDIEAQAKIDGLDADRLAQEIGATAADLSGKLDGAARLKMQGDTLGNALQKSEGAAILSMTDGSIKRAIIEKASTDLRTLFREREGASPITCLVAVLGLENGIVTLSPLRLEAKGATLVGSGTIDLLKKRVDIGARSERQSTGFFALDLPIKVSGTFDKLQAGLAGKADSKWQPAPGADMAKLAPEIRQLAAQNPCLD